MTGNQTHDAPGRVGRQGKAREGQDGGAVPLALRVTVDVARGSAFFLGTEKREKFLIAPTGERLLPLSEPMMPLSNILDPRRHSRLTVLALQLRYGATAVTYGGYPERCSPRFASGVKFTPLANLDEHG